VLERLLAALGGAGKAATAHGVELLAHGRKSHRTVVADAAALVGCRAIVRGSAAYGMPLALRLQGPLQVEVLRNSLNALAQRHEVLRTAYVQDDEGDPLAQIADRIEVDIALDDWSGFSPQEQQRCIAEATLANASTPIALEHAPLLRCRLARWQTRNMCCSSPCTTSSPMAGRWACWSATWLKSTVTAPQGRPTFWRRYRCSIQTLPCGSRPSGG
jgi:hypothetical protein